MFSFRGDLINKLHLCCKLQCQACCLWGKQACCCSVTQSCLTLCDLMDCTIAHQTFLSFTISQSLLKLTFTELVMPSNHFILCRPLLLPSIFPSTRVLSNESVLLIRWPKYWSFSFSIHPSMNIHDGFPLGLTGLISLQSKGLSRVSSNTTVQKHQFFSPQPSLWLNSQTRLSSVQSLSCV